MLGPRLLRLARRAGALLLLAGLLVAALAVWRPQPAAVTAAAAETAVHPHLRIAMVAGGAARSRALRRLSLDQHMSIPSSGPNATCAPTSRPSERGCG